MTLDHFFDANYYLEQYADVAADWSGTALGHYMSWGADEGRAPNAWFDAEYYRANNADLAHMTAIELFQHYTDYGYAEARIPDATYANFDAAAYLAAYSDLGKNGITEATALNHYLTFGIDEGRTAMNTDGTTITPVTNKVAGTTFNLTTDTDTFTGGAGADTFNAVADAGGIGSGETLNALDTLEGNGGIDTLNLAVTSPGSTIKGTFSGIEIVKIISDVVGDNAITFAGTGLLEDLTKLDMSGSSGDLTVDLDADTAVAVTEVLGGSGDDTITVDGTTGGVDISITGGTGADTIDISNAGAARVATVNFSLGDSGTTATTSDDITGFVSGTDKLSFGLADGDAENFVDGGASSGITDALTNANTAFDGAVQYFFTDIGANSALIVDYDLDGSGDLLVQLTGVAAGDIAAGDIIA